MEFAASLIAVVGLADQVIRCCSRYISAVKDCPSDIRVLLIETSTLKSVIGNLESLYKTGNSNPLLLEQLFAGLGGKDGPIKGCRDCLAEIDKLLPDDRAPQEGGQDQGQGYEKKGGRNGTKRRALQPTIERLAWPLRETRAKKLVDELRRFRESISLALVVDLSRTSREVDAKLQQLSDKLDETTREKILEWLVATEPTVLHNTTRGMREQHTGLWLDKSPEYREWKSEQGFSSSLWFYGIPGAGKSVLFSHIVEDIKTHCKAIDHHGDLPSICTYYYCYFGRNQDESLPLLSWILSQLARRVKYVPQELKDLFDSGHQPDSEVVLKALSELSQYFKTIYVLVDGLDESSNRANILRVIKKLRDDFPNLKLLAMSREENDIKEAMKRIGATTVSLSNRYVDEDIETYIRSELADNPRLSIRPQWLKQEIERGLVKGACGMFRWVSCQLEVLSRLHTISDIRRALGDLPRGLDATYERILSSISEEHKQRAKKALLLLAGGKLSFERPRVSVIAEAIMVDIDTKTFDPSDRILEPEEFIAETCTCLVRVDDTDPKNPRLLLAHYTVKEYLYSERIKHSKAAAYFYSSDELAEYETSMTSLVYLLNISYQGIPSAQEFLSATPSKQQEYAASVNKSFPLLEAASSAWLTSSDSDIKNPSLRAEVDSLLLRLFYPSPERFRWISWRALTIADDDWIHPVWSTSSLRAANPHDVALTLACYFDQPTIVSKILAAKHRNTTSIPSSDQSQNQHLSLDESYAAFWKQIYSNTIEPHPESENPLEDFDIHVHPEDYLPSGTPLEIALRFEAMECTRLLLLNSNSPTLDLSSYITTTPSGQRLSILSVALKACPNSVQTDFRPDYLEMLIELGASVNPPASMSASETPLQSAAMLVHVEAVSILLDAGADVNAVGNCGCYHDEKEVQASEGENNNICNGSKVIEEVVGSDLQTASSKKDMTTCWGHKSPLRIVREIMAARGVEESEVENLLRLNGALDFESKGGTR